ncbi:MAG: branched-chain amino acid transaminase [Bradymonadales bacterium]|nr:MAG: branched-chain amino acid transaminase [Bradymonadales bacterium]
MTANKKFPKLGTKVWWNGEMIPAESATLHVSAHSLHYGLGVFEGIRAYKQKDGGLGIFRGFDHMRRFVDSCRISGLPTPYSTEELLEACKSTVRESGFEACYLRPIGFLDAGPLGVAFDANTHPFTIAILSMDWGKYLGADAANQGAKIKISSFTRHHPNIAMTKAKLTGNYINSVMAKVEAKQMGFDEGILLDPEGYVAEGSGENLFVVKRGKVITPSVESVLEGITRDTVIQILSDMGVSYQERRMSRDELYAADEVFFSGTAAEITPIAEIDFRKIGDGRPGKLTQEISKRFFSIVTGENSERKAWIDRV